MWNRAKGVKGVKGALAIALLSTSILASSEAIANSNIVNAETVETVETVGEGAPAGVWTHPGDGWHYLTGTDISVKIENNCVYIYGTGDIPDFDIWRLYERPWGGTEVEYVNIAATVGSIGSYAFYDIPTLKRVDIHTSTFIKDLTTFDKIGAYSVFRVYGTIDENSVKERTIGDIKYTSIQSIESFAQSNKQGAGFIMDSKKEVEAFQNSTNPTLNNVYHASESAKYKVDGKEIKEAPWTNIERHKNGGKYTSTIKFDKSNPDSMVSVVAQRRFQGEQCMAAFSAFKGDWEYATSYTISVVGHDSNKPLATYKSMKYVLDIPKEFLKGDREFKLLAIGQGTVYEYEDLDQTGNTITFETDKPSTAYALLYKDIVKK